VHAKVLKPVVQNHRDVFRLAALRHALQDAGGGSHTIHIYAELHEWGGGRLSELEAPVLEL
jgi:hypothetical protein